LFSVCSKTKGEVRLDDESRFPALGAPMSLAWVHENAVSSGWHCQNPVESGNLSFSKTGIRWMSVNQRDQRI
jgi:hypothetical protein